MAKSVRSLNRAATARLNQAVKLSKRLGELTAAMRTEFAEGFLDVLKMAEARNTAAELTQAIHEFNAYSNVILTE